MQRKNIKTSYSSQKARLSTKQSKPDNFYIVGIGGSAGSIEAIEKFLKNTPSNIGMAFVFVIHLDPNHKSFLLELLQRCTKMKVFIVKHRMLINPNCVYVIPPNKDLSVSGGMLKLCEPVQARGLRLPIDSFLRSLAKDRQEFAVAVLFSGMGSDGSLGIKAIKECNGLVFVQDPASAKFDALLRNAIETGFVDHIATAEKLPEKLIQFVQYFKNKTSALQPMTSESDKNALQKIFNLLRIQTGNDFLFYKMSTILRRIEKRMAVHQTANLTHYSNFLQKNSNETQILLNELLIGVTQFFRDPAAFVALKRIIANNLKKQWRKNKVLRLWIPACSTGEEVYSLAILFHECLESRKFGENPNLLIYATDIDKNAIEIARKGIYPLNIAADVSPERLKNFFIADHDGYRVNERIREGIVFAQHNVISNPPFTKVDLLSCRNLLIYLTSELQQKLLPLFHYSLNPGGLLFLGSSESISSAKTYFSALDTKWKVFQRQSITFMPQQILDMPHPHISHLHEKIPAAKESFKETNRLLQDKIEKILLENYAPPCVIINASGDIVYIQGRTGKYLEPAAGKARMNIYGMAREGLKSQLRLVVRQASVQKKAVILKNLPVLTDAGTQTVNLTVKPLNDANESPALTMVLFEDVMKEKQSSVPKITAFFNQEKTNKALEIELEETKEQLQQAIEQMETTNEELKSSNEELQSSNEELISTNEELSTSKEELQSTNEELLTVNSEMEKKVEELLLANNDIKNFFESTDVTTLFLDPDLNLKRFTPSATKIMNVIESDLGRPITHIVTNLKYDSLTSDVRQVLKTYQPKEIRVESKDHHFYLLRILPYRTLSNKLNGTIITLTDITLIVQLEKSIADKQIAEEIFAFTRNILQSLQIPLLVLDYEYRVKLSNQAFYETFQVSKEEIHHQLIHEPADHQWNIPEFIALLKKSLSKGTIIRNYEIEHNFPRIGFRNLLLNICPLPTRADKKNLLLSIEDITERRTIESEIQKDTDIKLEFISTVSHELRSPLSVIQSSIDLTLRAKNSTLTDAQKSYLSLAQKNIERLLRLINDILNFQKIDVNKIIAINRTADINKLIRNVLTQLTHDARAKGLQLQSQLPENLPKTHCQKDGITQVLINLIGNAIKYSNSGKIIVSAELKKKNIVVSVQDEGPGIRKNDQAKIFETFVRINPGNKKQHGTGLGLSISKKIVEKHKGKIGVNSAYGHGSTFYFTLPF